MQALLNWALKTFLLALISAPVCALAETRYGAKEQGYNLELLTPYGNKIIYGSFSLDGVKDYQLEIPLEVLRPSANTPVPSASIPASPAAQNGPPPPLIVTLPETPDKEKKKTEDPVREPASLPPVGMMPPAIPLPTTPAKPEPPPVVYEDSDRFIVEANRLFNKGKFYEASFVVEELLRKKPDSVRGWIMKGSLMHVMGHKDLALKAWQTAQKLEPGNGEIKSILQKYK